MEAKKPELVFIPAPGMGHLVSAVELAKLLIDRDERLSITVLVISLPSDFDFGSAGTAYIQSLSSSTTMRRIHFFNLPQEPFNSQAGSISRIAFFTLFIESHKPRVKDAVTRLVLSESQTRLAGFVVDMFCVTMIDVANEFSVPSYAFFTSGAAFLSMRLHVQKLHDEHDVNVTEFKGLDTELVIPSFTNPVPGKVFPSSMLDKDSGFNIVLEHARRFRETKGIMVNTFMELESYAITSLFDAATPQVYPVGPILNLKGGAHVESGGSQRHDEIIKWLDDQPPSSVVFMCFGSLGCFGPDQVKEIAHGLESSGQRFIWSLRRPPPKDKIASPSDYTNLEEVLPKGFLDRTAEISKVIGWAPQLAILAHPAIGGFVSHCGWNSILESLWFGVPIATLPMYAEQQLNAFEMVKELGLAVEVKLDYRSSYGKDPATFVDAKDIERGIRCVMEHDSEVRKKVKELREKSRNTLLSGGSSHAWLGRFIDDVIQNMP